MSRSPLASVPVSSASSRAIPSWSERYGKRHRLVRIDQFPAGISAPKKVRIYFRQDHYVLQWWEPREKTNLSHRVDGDLVAAIAQARQFDERLTTLRDSGQPRHRRLAHDDLVAKFVADLERRANADEIDPKTVRRYAAALTHYLGFCKESTTACAYSTANTVNREFRLAFAAFLAQRSVTGNGRGGAKSRPMQGQAFVIDAVRALFEWAADPARGGLLPDGFHNPFRRTAISRSVFKGDPLSEPDITLPMALDFIAASDTFQLRLFAPMLLFGLRAAEPCFLFAEYLTDGWWKVPNNPDLNVKTKGRLDKRFPMLEELKPLWNVVGAPKTGGLLYTSRAVEEERQSAPLRGQPLAELIEEYRRRCVKSKDISAAGRRRTRDELIRDAGGLNYDVVEAEFAQLARGLKWPPKATLKDLRHLFATTMNNAAMPEPFRRYLMGQAPGRAAIIAYTHLNEIKRHYAEAVRKEWSSLLTAINQRVKDLTPAHARVDRRTDCP